MESPETVRFHKISTLVKSARFRFLSSAMHRNSPPRGVLMKRCSENKQQIYSRTPMSKCRKSHFGISVLLHIWRAASECRGVLCPYKRFVMNFFCKTVNTCFRMNVSDVAYFSNCNHSISLSGELKLLFILKSTL